MFGPGRMPFLRTQQKTEFSDEFTIFVFDGQNKKYGLEAILKKLPFIYLNTAHVGNKFLFSSAPNHIIQTLTIK